MSDYEKMSRAELIQRWRALELVDNDRRLTEAEERVHLIQSVVEQGFSAGLIWSVTPFAGRRSRIRPD